VAHPYRLSATDGRGVVGRATAHDRLNGKKVTADYGSVPADGATPEASEQLLYWLREQHDQKGPKFGFGVAQCGACTVLIDGVPVGTCPERERTSCRRQGRASSWEDGSPVARMSFAAVDATHHLAV